MLDDEEWQKLAFSVVADNAIIHSFIHRLLHLKVLKDLPDVPPKSLYQRGDLQNVPSGAGRSRVSLQTVPVRVCGGEDGPEIKTYAFLDNGSDTTLCLSSLGVSGKPVHFSLSSMSAENISKSGYEVSLNAFALDGDDPILLDRVWTVDRPPIS